MRTIREELDGLPPLGDVDQALREAGRLGRRRGRVRSGALLAAAAAAVAAVVGGAALVTQQSADRTPAAADSPSASADPTEIRGAFLSAADAAAGGKVVWTRSTVEALDAQDNVIEGEDRIHATRWRGIFQADDREELRLILIQEDPLTVDDARRDCSLRLEVGDAVTCDVSLQGDLVLQQITRGAQEDPEGWPVVAADEFESQGPNLWLMQQVIMRSPSGTAVYASEVAHASSWKEAASIWVIDQADLPDLAARIALPLAEQTGCGWLVAEARDSVHCE